jgi:hypothetical protein
LYIGGHFGFKMATIANQRLISIRNIIIYLETKFRPNLEDFCILGVILDSKWRHSKPTKDINSQHHNLLGNKISCKSEYICILAAILDLKWSL